MHNLVMLSGIRLIPDSLEEMNRVLGTVVLDPCILEPCPSWLDKATRKGACGWIHAILNVSEKGGDSTGSERGSYVPPSQEASLGQSGKFSPSLQLSTSREGC